MTLFSSPRSAVRSCVRSAVYPITGVTDAVPTNGTVVAYMEATGISAGNAVRVESFLTELTSTMGTAPVFLWVGGNRYNQADQTALVIGTGGEMVGGEASNPSAVSDAMRTGRNTKFFRANNPTSGDSAYLWVVWYRLKDRAATHNVIALRESAATTEKGPLLAETVSASQIESSSNGSTANPNVFPLGSGSPTIDGLQCIVIRGNTAFIQKTQILFSARHEPRSAAMWNSHAKVRIGGVSDTSTTDALLSNMEVHAVAGFDTAGTAAAMYAVRNSIVAGNLIPADTSVPAMISLGDSTTASRWNYSMHQGVQGGAWRGNVVSGNVNGVTDSAMGGTDFSEHVAWKTDVITTLNQLPWSQRYFVYTVDTPADMKSSASWAAIGVTEGDIPGYYDAVETFLQDIETATGCVIVACSYLRGNNSNSSTFRESERDYVSGIASSNGWHFVDFWADPHSQVWTGASPGTYGFYEDTIHPADPGKLIQAEVLAASLPHPVKTSAPRFDVANPPTITGTQQVGQTLTCSTGTPHVAPDSYSYQWLNNLTAIGGATSSTYTLQAGDEGDRIACRVTAIKAGENSASFTSAPTGAIAAA